MQNIKGTPRCSLAATAPHAARALFPRGLVQPPGSFRFSVDALLLAAFTLAKAERAKTLLDLGCGCGVAAFAVLLRRPDLCAVGLDIQPDCVDAANANARNLGLADRFFALARYLKHAPPGPALADPVGRTAPVGCADLTGGQASLANSADPADRAGLADLADRAAAFDLVMANPPFRRPEQGRLPRSEARRIALFADAATLPAFMAAARRALAPDGRFCLIYPADDLPKALKALAEHGLTPLRTLPVQTRPADPPLRVLVEATLAEQAIGRQLRHDPPLTLFQDEKGKEYTAAARAFCLWLAP